MNIANGGHGSSWTTNLAVAGIAPAGPSAYSSTSGFLTTNLSSSSLNPTGQHLSEPAAFEDPNIQSIEVDFADSKAHYYVKVVLLCWNDEHADLGLFRRTISQAKRLGFCCR